LKLLEHETFDYAGKSSCQNICTVIRSKLKTEVLKTLVPQMQAFYLHRLDKFMK